MKRLARVGFNTKARRDEGWERVMMIDEGRMCGAGVPKGRMVLGDGARRVRHEGHREHEGWVGW